MMTELEFKKLLDDKLCDMAEIILQYYNPCKIEPNKCLVTDDILKGNLHCCYHHEHRDKPCNKLNGNICENRNTKCRLWLCATAISKNPECTEDLRDLENIAKRYGLTKRPFLGDRYVGRNAELAAMREREEAMKKD